MADAPGAGQGRTVFVRNVGYDVDDKGLEEAFNEVGPVRQAFLVCDKGARVDEASVLKALDGRLAKFKMPKRVIVVDELPRNAMGKVQKNVLRDTYKDIYSK